MGIVEKCDEAFSITEEGFDVDIPQNALKKVRFKPIRHSCSNVYSKSRWICA